MKPINKIDYSKFKCEVFSPDGILLKEARINAQNDFYCSGLVPGQEYVLVFSYSDIMIECIEFICETVDRVVYISPAHIVSNKEVHEVPHTFINSIKNKVKRHDEFNVPHMRWAKKALDAFIESTHEGKAKCIPPKKVVKFKAGSDLASKVK